MKKLFFLLALVISGATYGQVFSKSKKLDTNSPLKSTDQLISANFNLPEGITLSKLSSKTDQLGMVHEKYQLMLNNIPIYDGIIKIHYKNNKPYYISGCNLPKDVASAVGISREKSWQSIIAQKGFTKLHPSCKTNGKPTYLVKNNRLELCWETEVYSIEPLAKIRIFTSQNTGQILHEESELFLADVLGTAQTKYSGTRTITTDSVSAGQYRLVETGRGGGIVTLDLKKAYSSAGAVDFTDTDNNWNNVNTDKDEVATDAHWAAEMFYDYFNSTFTRNSYDDAGAQLKTHIHYGVNFTNAFWDGSAVNCGDGNGTTSNAYTALDIVAHEFSHGLIENEANLTFSYESGALAEAFCDIFATAVEFYAKPSAANYTIGENLTIGTAALRNMANPNQFNQPDTYQGTFWATGSQDNGGVHTNGGVANFWFYLLANGGTGTNDLGNSYNVPAIGLTDAMRIAYRTMTVYLTSTSNYADARAQSIQAATDLFGNCSAEVNAVTYAWHAVGVGALPSNNPVIANFSANPTASCSIPVTVNFTNLSQNGNISNKWYFGDGDSSLVNSPNHTYTASGIYTVTLITTGVGSCGQQTDTLTKTNFIDISSGSGVTPTTCNMTSTPSANYGITRFNMGSVDRYSANSVAGGYQDFSCTGTISALAGRPFNFLSENGYELLTMYLDKNNDGTFSSTEQIYSSSVRTYNHSGSLTLSSGIVLSTPLRLRVISHYYSALTPCNNFTYGQAEDYSFTLYPDTLPPTANFSASATIINTGQSVTFTDLSIGSITSWQWQFPGGIPSNSTAANPTVTYNSMGNFPVTLIVTNANSSDTLTFSNYINVTTLVNMCSSSTSTSSVSGTLHDSGGPNFNYSNSQNCSFLIDPGCGSPITLSFSSFNLENSFDYLKIYDGPNASSPLIANLTGSFLPANVTASSGTMFVRFTSDGSVTLSGFVASWNTSTTGVIPPVADFSFSPTNPAILQPVLLADSSQNQPNSWLWNFGDGNYSSLQNPTHNYSGTGTYDVSLIVGNCNTSDTVTYQITVQDTALVSYTVDTSSTSFYCGDTANFMVTLYNTGAGDLMVTQNPTYALSTVEILAYTLGTNATEYNNTISALNSQYTNYNLTQTTTTDPAVLQSLLTNKDIFLLPEIASSSTPNLSIFAQVLQNFVTQGGMVISTGNSTRLFQTGLWPVVNYTNISGGYTLITVPNTTYTAGVPSSFFSTNSTTRFTPSANETAYVAQTSSYNVVSEKTMGAGKIVFMGFDFYNYNIEIATILGNIVRSQERLGSFFEIVDTTYIPVGDSVVLSLGYFAENVFAGNYTDSIILSTNDMNNPNLTIAFNYTVLGSPQIATQNPCINFGQVYNNYPTTDSIWIYNNGCDSLTISALNAPSEYAFNWSSTVVAPYDSISLHVTVTDTVIGNNLDTLWVLNNDVNVAICLTGQVVNFPVLQISPASLTANLGACADSVTFPVMFYNTGGATLSYNCNLSQGYDSTITTYYNLTGQNVYFNFGNIPSTDSVFLEITYNGDYDGSSEYVQLYVDNAYQGIIPDNNVSNGVNIIANYAFGGAQVQNWLADGIITVLMDNSTDVNTGMGGTQMQRVRLFTNTGNSFSFNPISDTIISGDSASVLITINNSSYNTGINQDTIWISTNNPTNPISYLPITINVDQKPCAQFTNSNTLTCSGFMTFTDASTNNPTSWSWDFGDGQTASTQNPEHIYQTGGTYNVTLVACNGYGCDTIVKPVIINNNDGAGPGCQLSAYYNYTNYDIVNFKLGTIDNASLGSNPGYTDFTCSPATELKEFLTYPFTITSNSTGNVNAQLYIDYNANGTFETSEKVYEVFGSPNIINGSFTVPSGIAAGSNVRIRAIVEISSVMISGPCGYISYGEAEDYTANLKAYNEPPVANFDVIHLSPCDGIMSFVDSSKFQVNGWNWNFGDGTTSSNQNPYHTYDEPGIYTVTLTATNPYGSTSHSEVVVVNSLSSSFIWNTNVLGESTTFTSTAAGAITWNWNFGDGTSGTGMMVNHTYTDTGCYDVNLTVMNGFGCTSSTTDEICIEDHTSVDENEKISFNCYPNPANNEITIVPGEKAIEQVIITDARGRIVVSEAYKYQQFNLKELERGMYVISVIFVDESRASKQLILQ